MAGGWCRAGEVVPAIQSPCVGFLGLITALPGFPRQERMGRPGQADAGMQRLFPKSPPPSWSILPSLALLGVRDDSSYPKTALSSPPSCTLNLGLFTAFFPVFLSGSQKVSISISDGRCSTWQHCSRVCTRLCVCAEVGLHLAVQGLCALVHLLGNGVTTGLCSETPTEEPAIADNIHGFLLLMLQAFFYFHSPKDFF